MTHQRDQYRKSYTLIVAFIVLITISLVMAVFLARNMVVNDVEHEFVARKVDILENAIAPYNHFFSNSIPEISFYQGYLDSAGVASYADSLLATYPFIDRIMFYDLLLSNEQEVDYGFSANELTIYPKGAYEFSLDSGSFTHARKNHYTLSLSDDFNNMAVKFGAFIERVDTTRGLDADDLYRVFYEVSPGKVSYTNIPRMDDIKIYKELMNGEFEQADARYEQDAIVYYIDATKLALANVVPELYQDVQIQPLVYERWDANLDLMTTDAPLPGALADYKIYLSASRSFLTHEINRRLLPVSAAIFGVYLILMTVAYLIYRNLYVNQRMFKLQYDFVNNLTHEFKTPVSVIKIAGNNISQAKQLSDKERQLYGKILDEEADKLNNLMNTLLSFTQIENKSIKIERENIDLHEFCDKIMAAFKLKYPDFDISYKVDVDRDLYADPVLLGSIFRNLIENAYKYSRKDSKVLRISVRRAKNDFVFAFADKGIGIAKSELQHIFKKFYRVQSQYNQQGSVGLGLAFCKELVNTMGGTITADSVEGKGTTFTMTLPID